MFVYNRKHLQLFGCFSGSNPLHQGLYHLATLIRFWITTGKHSQCVHQEKSLVLNVAPVGTERLGLGWCHSPMYGLKPSWGDLSVGGPWQNSFLRISGRLSLPHANRAQTDCLLLTANAVIFLHIQTRTGKCPRMVKGHAGGSSAIATGHAVQYWPNKHSCVGNLRGRENCGVSLLLRRCISCSVGSPCYLICLRVCFLFKISWIAL